MARKSPERISSNLVPQSDGAIVGTRQQQALIQHKTGNFIRVAMRSGDDQRVSSLVADFPEADAAVRRRRVHAKRVRLCQCSCGACSNMVPAMGFSSSPSEAAAAADESVPVAAATPALASTTCGKSSQIMART